MFIFTRVVLPLVICYRDVGGRMGECPHSLVPEGIRNDLQRRADDAVSKPVNSTKPPRRVLKRIRIAAQTTLRQLFEFDKTVPMKPYIFSL